MENNKKVYYAYAHGFAFDNKVSIRVTELTVIKETEKQYQLTNNGKGYTRLNKYFIGNKDSIGRYYALSPEEAVANLKADLRIKKEIAEREIKRFNALLNCEPIIEN